MTIEDNFAFFDLPATKYPFVVSAYPKDSVADECPCWSVKVDDPGGFKVPGIDETKQRVRIVIRYADGTMERT